MLLEQRVPEVNLFMFNQNKNENKWLENKTKVDWGIYSDSWIKPLPAKSEKL